MTVGELMEQWLEVKVTLRATTADSYSETVRRHVIARIGHIRLGALTPTIRVPVTRSGLLTIC